MGVWLLALREMSGMPVHVEKKRQPSLLSWQVTEDGVEFVRPDT